MKKLIIDLDPGVGDAVATALALVDPELDVLALTATAGGVSGAIATRNVQAVVAHLDPQRWPRIGTARGPALVTNADRAACGSLIETLNGPTGLGDLEVVVPELHHRHESSRVMIEVVRDHPHQVTLLTLGPLTNVVAACERAPDFLELLGGLVCLGGSVAAGGDMTAAAETNFYLDPDSARIVFSTPEAKTLVPLDVANQWTLSLEQFTRVSSGSTPAAAFLQKLLPYSFRAHHQYLGMESIRLREVVALAVAARPGLFRLQPMPVDIEVQGELTRGMSVVDRRPHVKVVPRTSVVVQADAHGVLDYVTQLLR
ncbi:MAG: nucleoside hydrolase [Planctomycetaceae bacterium]